MSPLSNAERQRRWRERLKGRAGAISVSNRDPDTMTAEERIAEVASLANALDGALARLLPVAYRLYDVTLHMEVGEPGATIGSRPIEMLEDVQAIIRRSLSGGDLKKPKRKKKKR